MSTGRAVGPGLGFGMKFGVWPEHATWSARHNAHACMHARTHIPAGPETRVVDAHTSGAR